MTESLEPLVDAIYGAALDAARWPAALALINDRLAAVASGLSYRSFETGAFWREWHGLDPTFERLYAAHYHRFDPWIDRCHALPEGTFLSSETVCPSHELARTAYYNELCKPFEIEHGVSVSVVRTPVELVAFGAMRRVGAPMFGETERRTLAALTTHLRRAYEIQKRLARSGQAERASWHALDSLPVAVLLLDAQHRVVRANASAERLLASPIVLAVGTSGELGVTASVNERAWLRVLSGRGGGAPVPLARERGRPLLATSMPVRSGAVATTVEAHNVGRLVIVADPDAEPTTAAEVLARTFDLTRAEVAVALAVGRGRAPKEAAEMLGTTWNTVRGHLKIVYAKTGARGQVDLVRLVASLGLLPIDRSGC